MADIAELQIDLLHRDVDPVTMYTIEMRGLGAPISDIAETGSFSLPAAGLQGQEYGRALYTTLFPKDSDLDKQMRNALKAIIINSGLPLRVRLRIRDDPGEFLSKHHWEMLCDPSSGEWLFTKDLLHFRRYLQFPEGLDTTPPRAGPIRTLVVIANPSDLRDSWTPGDPSVGGRHVTRIRVDEEKSRALEGLSKLAAQVEYLVSEPGHRVTANALWQSLNAPESWDILYLVCHGGYQANGPKGAGYYLLLEGDTSPSDLVPVGDLVSQVKGQTPERRPRLVVLVSCQSGDSRKSANGDSLLGIGQRLVQEAGVLAAVAMQGDFTMDTAEIFMPAFFDALREGDGLVERAMAVARRQTSHSRPDWFVPVLFSRTWDGRLWPSSGTMAGDAARRRLERRRIYVAHPALASAEEAATFDSVKGLLSRSGFDVIESENQPVPGDRWIQRALLELGTCDGAVLLLTESALTGPTPQLQAEARLLSWRASLEPEFPVVTFILSPACEELLKGETWRLLCPSTVDCIPAMPVEDRAVRLRTALERLRTVVYHASPWRVQDLKAGIARRIRRVGIEGPRLSDAAEDLWNQGAHGLPLPQDDAFVWWAGALLCKGPTLLLALVNNVVAQLDPDNRDELNKLQDAITPSWVDITAAGLIPIILHQTGDQADPRTCSFHVALCPGTEKPADVADWYLKRAFGLPGDDPRRAIGAALKGDLTEKLKQIREEVRVRLKVVNGNDQDIDRKIKEKISEKARGNNPVILQLDDKFIQDQPLLKKVREQFGPIVFFFLGFGPQVAKEAGILSLEPPPAEESYLEMQKALDDLNQILKRNNEDEDE